MSKETRSPKHRHDGDRTPTAKRRTIARHAARVLKYTDADISALKIAGAL